MCPVSLCGLSLIPRVTTFSLKRRTRVHEVYADTETTPSKEESSLEFIAKSDFEINSGLNFGARYFSRRKFRTGNAYKHQSPLGDHAFARNLFSDNIAQEQQEREKERERGNENEKETRDER